MSPDRMSVPLRRIRVVAVLVDLIERLVVEIVDVRRVVRGPHCGLKTTRVHDDRRPVVHESPDPGSTCGAGVEAASLLVRGGARSGGGRTHDARWVPLAPGMTPKLV